MNDVKHEVWKEFKRFGTLMESRGLILSSHSGNMSVRRGNKIFITRRGCMLGDLAVDDVVETSLQHIDHGVLLASTEINVHRNIYMNTPALAIIHAHTLYAIVMSFFGEEFVPVDQEGAYVLHKVPIIDVAESIGSDVVAKELATVLKNHSAAIVKAHGVFSRGKSLEEAYHIISAVEASCMIKYMAMTAGADVKRLEGGNKW